MPAPPVVANAPRESGAPVARAARSPSPAVPAGDQAARAIAADAAQQQADVREFVGRLLNEIATPVGAVQFELDDSSGKAIIRVVDKETKTVIRQVPAPETLAIRAAIDRMQGILVRLKA